MKELGVYFDVIIVARSEHVEGFQDQKINIFVIKLRNSSSKSDEF